jgi:hypothetical protein
MPSSDGSETPDQADRMTADGAYRSRPTEADSLIEVSERADESRRSRSANPIAIFAATLLVVAVAVAIWWFGRSDLGQNQNQFQQPTAPATQIVPQNPPLPTLTGAMVTVDQQGDPVFSWTNPEPQAGDQYKWWFLGKEDQVSTTGETHLALPRDGFGSGPVCIEVQLVRQERTSQDQLRICEE